MTLPFRRRHNDHEASHDRARALITLGFIEPTDAGNAAWLGLHLAGCLECRNDAEAYAADRGMLRLLRDDSPEPPRDLWARTAAEIEREAGRRERRPRPAASLLGWRIGRVPVGAVSGLIVVLVVVGASLVPRFGSLLGPSPAGSDVALGTGGAAPTPIALDAVALAWIQTAPDGTYQFVQARVHEVCPDQKVGCAPLSSGLNTRLSLTEAPQAVILSPAGTEIVVVTGASTGTGGDVFVVPVPPAPVRAETPSPASSSATPEPTATGPVASSPSPTDSASSRPTPTVPLATPASSASPAASSAGSPEVSPEASPGPEVSGGYAIASGVVVVGDAAYSPDGAWLAFSARLADGATGPDLYLWRVGDPLAIAVTSDHRTYFAGWLGGLVLANRVEPDVAEEAPPVNADATTPPSLKPTPEPTPGGSVDPNATPAASPVIAEDHPVALLLDPDTGVETPMRGWDMWHPTVDPTGRSIVYWSGTLVRDGTGMGWTLGTGRLVLDGWENPSTAAPGEVTPEPGSTEVPGSLPADAPEATATPGPTVANGDPLPAIGPAGHPVVLAEGPLTDFDTWFDPEGIRLAVWIADPDDPAVGTLRLVVLDPDTLALDPTADPLPGVAALRGVSMNSGRLAWVTPPGQDGEGSHVQVLGWRGRDFGQIRTIQGEHLSVVR